MSGTHLDPASTTTAPSLSSSATTSRPAAEPSEVRKVSFQQPRPAATPSRSSSSAHLAASGASGSSQAGTGSQAYSAYSGVTRRHSLFGTEDRVILDIGSRYSKFGFSGEPRPRAIVPSVAFAQPSTSYLRLDASSSDDPYATGDTLWDLDFERCRDDQLRRGKRALLLAQLTQLLRNAFTQHLMVDPKQRKVLVVENPMLPTSVKEMICKVLFDNLQVPSVSFVPAPLLSLLAVGRITGLVLEVGYLETTLMPVYYGRPLTSHTVSSSRAGKRLNARLKTLLLRYGKFVAAQNGLQDSAKSLKERTRSIDPVLLTDERLEQIKAKALFVSSYDSALEAMQELFSVLEHDPSEAPNQTSIAESKAEAAKSIRQKYSAASSATPFTFAITPESVDPNSTASLIQSVQAQSSTSTSTLTPGSSSSLQKNRVSGVIAIPGWVRERAAELLFEQGDHDDPGLMDITVGAIARLPIDLRRVMCETPLVSGGTAMLPGFANRFRSQLALAIEKAEQPGGELSIDRHTRRIKPDQDGKDKQTNEGGSKLHRSVAGLNDPWPDVTRSQSSKTGKGSTEGGSAPAFAANLLPWMGASLAGALKTTSLNAISREAYDEATKTVQDETETAQEGADQEKENLKEKGAKANRPAMSAASKRGSFVGVVGGLETGAYGGLAAVSRHLVGVPGGAGSGSSGANQSKSATPSSTSSSSAAKSPSDVP
ncbi:related to ACT1 - Actin [Ustilago sp. UG-2017b]|nr:related to ACT1 - Actin [Ustilago sp. UG-2017b]